MADEIEDAQFEVAPVDQAKPVAAVPFNGVIGLLTPEMIAKAEAAVEGVKRVKAIALKVTSYNDWVALGFGDKRKGYLTESGCKKLANLWGVSFRNAEVKSVDREVEGHIVREFTAKVTADFQGRVVTEFGTCDSEYDFYRSAGKDKDGNKLPDLPFAERDFASMKKHAFTNAYARALKACLGIGTVPWAEVEAALGASASKSSNVAFDKGGTAPTKPPQTVASADAGDQRKKLWAMCLDLNDHDQELAGNYLEKHTSFTGKDGKPAKGFRDPFNTRISDAWVRTTYGKVKELWLPEFGGPPPEAQGEFESKP